MILKLAQLNTKVQHIMFAETDNSILENNSTK